LNCGLGDLRGDRASLDRFHAASDPVPLAVAVREVEGRSDPNERTPRVAGFGVSPASEYALPAALR
jgi:hypothetical protein